MILIGVLVLLCITLVIGLPVPFAFGTVMIYLALFADLDPATFLVSGYWRLNNLVLLAIPLFILAGAIMQRGGIAGPLIHLIELFVNRVRGGASATVVIASAMFGAISGSASATLTCVGSILLPRLKKANYPEGYAAALVVNSAPLGLLIPPSALQIIYAWITGQSVLRCFLATVIPAFILVFLLCCINFALMLGRKEIIVEDKVENFPLVLKKRTVTAAPALLMPLIILGGIYGGIMTPTEAAGIAVLYAIPVGWIIYKGFTWKTFIHSVGEAATTIGVIMIMFFMVMIVSRLLVFEDVSGVIHRLVLSASSDPLIVLLMVNIALIFVGMLMDDVSGVLISAPLLLPVVQEVGVDPIHFAAIIGVNLGLGNVTPPTAPLLYLGARVADTEVSKMIAPTIIMIVFAWIPTLAITTYVPEVALWLPNLLLK